MMRNRMILWLGAGAAAALVAGVLALLLVMQEADAALRWVGYGAAGLAYLWLWVGPVLGWPARWAKWMVGWLASGTFFVVAYFGLHANGHEGTAVALAGLYWMALLFCVGLWLLRLVLSPGLPVVGVARTLLDEAIRMKVPLIFIILLAVLVPLLPLMIDPEERLTYQVRSFLTYALAATSFFLSLMTIFLAAATITGEVSRKQIFLTMTKPVGRLQYLLGKWLGVVLLNVLLLSVVTSGIYVFARFMEARGVESARAAANVQRQRELGGEVEALRDEVLAARQSVRPQPGSGFDEQAVFMQRLEQLKRENPDVFDTESQTLDPELAREIWGWVAARWHTVPPRNARTFVFTGLGDAHRYGDEVQLRINPKLTEKSPDDKARMAMRINDEVYAPRGNPNLVYAANTVHFVPIPVRYIDENGVLSLQIANMNVQMNAATRETIWESSMTFEPGDGMEILYTVGTFEENLLRASYVLIVRLAFLAMFALMIGTFTGFPVACLVSIVVYLTAVGSGFINESLTYFAAMGPREATGWERFAGAWDSFLEAVTEKGAWDAFKVVTRVVAELFTGLVPSFSRYNVGALIADGRLVPNGMLAGATGWIGGLWTGACMLIAWLIWRKRELAKVTV